MDNSKNIDLIFEEWSANLRSKDRKIAAVRSNFEELFQKWHDAGITRDELHPLHLQNAIKFHQPSPHIAKEAYKRMKNMQRKSEKDFIEGWNKEIKDIATEAFFEYFPLDIEAETKVYGNLGKNEYQHQRRLSSQFPILDTTELEKRLHDRNDDLDLEDLKRALLGDGGKNE